MNGVPAGLSAFRADVANWVWAPSNPSVWSIENPPLAYDQNWNTVDLDGNGVADFDRDGDNLPDLWEYRYTLNLRDGQDAYSDPDGDQLPNWEEYQYGTNPRLADSDGDGFSDSVEVLQGGNPVVQSVMPPLTLQVVGSSSQAIYTGQTSPALAVKVTQGGLPVAGVTVAFQLTAGGGRLQPASSAVGVPGSSLSQTTASDGIAAVTYVSAMGEPEGTASISAGAAGAAAQAFTVSIVAIPAAYDDAGGSDSTVGATGGVSGNPTKVPTPPRSTAMDAASIAAASADGYRIRVKRKFDTQSSYPADDLALEYLTPYGLNPAALVGWQTGFATDSWVNQTRLEFEALPPPPPSQKPVVPSGARRYLVLVYQGVEVESDTSVPKYAGELRFQYSDTGARMITLTGGIPDKFIKTDGSESVTIEPPLATKAEERVWVSLQQIGFRLRNNEDVTKGWDDTGAEAWTSVGVGKTNSIVKLVGGSSNYELVVDPGSTSYLSVANETITTGDTNLSITGIADTKNLGTDGAKIVFRQKGSTTSLAVLHVHVLPLQEINVNVFHASDEGPGRVPASAIPSSPAPADIVTELNSTYEEQTNIKFTASAGNNPTVVSNCDGCFYAETGRILFGDTAYGHGSILVQQYVQSQISNKAADLGISIDKALNIVIVKDVAQYSPRKDVDGITDLSAGYNRYPFVDCTADISTFSHETGHALYLSTRTDPGDDPGNKHDPGPSPDGKTPIMGRRISGMVRGRWLRQEDWRKANDAAGTDY